MSREEFRDAVKQWRAASGFTQEEAAQYLGISVRTLQNWEIARNMPTGYGLKALLQIIAAPVARGGISTGLETHLL